MIIGSGLIAKEFAIFGKMHPDACIYAAGVSNSACIDVKEFDREKIRLIDSLQKYRNASIFAYFGTCSLHDPLEMQSRYVLHKLEMEKLVMNHPRHMIFRLPQLAGKTPNPHTLLNYLYAKIARSESFKVWKFAYRNIIDISDVALIVDFLMNENKNINSIINVSNPVNYSVLEIVNTLEAVTKKRAFYDLVDKGSNYFIDSCLAQYVIDKLKMPFDKNYLFKTISKYYA